MARITLYRGIDCRPQDYDPSRPARTELNIPGRRETRDMMSCSTEMRSAMNYSSGFMNRNLSDRSRGPSSKGVIVELEFPHKKDRVKTRNAKEHFYLRSKVPDDLQFAKRIGVHHSRVPRHPEKLAGDWDPHNRIEWYRVEAFCLRFRTSVDLEKSDRWRGPDFE